MGPPAHRYYPMRSYLRPAGLLPFATPKGGARLMARTQTARPLASERPTSQRSRPRRLPAMVLPLLALLLSLIASGTAAAQSAAPLLPHGGGGGIQCAKNPASCFSQTPAYCSGGTTVTVNGAHLPPGAKITIGYSQTSCASGVVTLTAAGGTPLNRRP